MTRAFESLADLLEDCAQRAPARLALTVDHGPHLSYGELSTQASSFAAGLINRSAVPGSVVGLLYENDQWAEFSAAYFGIIRAGCIPVALSPRWTEEQLVARLADVGAVGAITHLPIPCGDWWTAEASDLYTEHQPAQWPAPASGIGAMVFTSGTTGTPRAVAISRDSMLPAHAPRLPKLSNGLQALHAFPTSTSSGLSMLIGPLHDKPLATLTMPVFDPGRFLELVTSNRVHSAYLTPSMASLIVRTSLHEIMTPRVFRRLVLSTEPAAPSLLEALTQMFPQTIIATTYGLSESSSGLVQIYDPNRPQVLGRVGRGTQVAVVDSRGQFVSTGEAGELVVRERHAPRYYVGDIKGTQATFRDSWVHTGDLGYIDHEGYVYLIDRLKDVINVGGLKVSTLSVANAILEHPDIFDAAVVSAELRAGFESVVALICSARDIRLAELARHLHRRVADYERPSLVITVESIPRTEVGKVDKVAIRRMIAAHLRRAGEPFATEKERIVGETVADVLGLQVRFRDASLIELGAQSLDLARLAAALSSAFDVELSVADLLEHPRVADIARLAEDAARGNRHRSPIPRLER